MKIVTKTTILWLAAVALTIASGRASSQTLYYLSVAETQDAERPGEFTSNKKAVDDFIGGITAKKQGDSSTTGLTIKKTDVKDQDFKCSTIFDKISELPAELDKDVVVFYYSGHGEAADESGQAFPKLICGASAGDRMPTLHYIYELLQQKNPRLLIVVADACNDLASRKSIQMNLAPDSNDAKIYSLFRDFKGFVLMASAQRGEPSFYRPRSVGFFTNRLLGLLSSPPEKSPKMWDLLLDDAKLPIDIQPLVPGKRDSPRKQHPEVRAKLNYDPTK